MSELLQRCLCLCVLPAAAWASTRLAGWIHDATIHPLLLQLYDSRSLYSIFLTNIVAVTIYCQPRVSPPRSDTQSFKPADPRC